VTKSNNAEKEQKPETQSASGFNPSAFIKETKEELDKVVWPDRQRLIGESAAVILMVALSAGLISLVDQLFGWISGLVF
jgi:preprotein translocase subunit SecE